MTVDTCVDVSVDAELLHNYFRSLVNSFFKILPMKENEESSLPTYIDNFRCELIGCRDFIPELGVDPQFLSLLAILQYLLDHPECTVKKVRREVFSAISVCNKLKAQYMSEVLTNDSVG